MSKRPVSLILAFRQFQKDLNGWGVVSFDEFRHTLQPLGKRAWGDKERKQVAGLVAAGAGYALKCLYKGMPAAKELQAIFKEQKLGDGPDAPGMSKGDLEAHLKALTASCARDGWTRSNFESYLTYLESDMKITDLRSAPAGAASMFGSASVDLKVPEQDLFGELFRSGGEAYKNVVRAHLKSAASSATNTSTMPTESANAITPQT